MGHEALDGVLKWNPKVACRTLEGTAFILLSSRMVSLNEVGTFIWESLKEGATLDQVVASVLEEFDTSPDVARADARELISTLLEKEMLVPAVPRT
jgi:hypothetical protein